MSNEFYAEMAATAAEMLREFGVSVTVSRLTPGAYDPETGTNAAGTTQTWTPWGVMLEYSQREIDGTNIKAGDQRVYMSTTADLDPKPADTVTIGTEVWRVVTSRTLAPAGLKVLLDVQVRR